MTDLSVSDPLTEYKPENKIRFVTAASLFDGHDASINIMRRILQATGVEVIHLGHNRSVEEVVVAALQEDAQGIAVSSYQGGHVEYFKYMLDLLRERGGENIKVFGGGGGVIVPAEVKELEDYGVARLYSPPAGRRQENPRPARPGIRRRQSPGTRHHRHRRRGQELAHRRARAPAAPRPGGPAQDRRHLDRPLAQEDRRGAARRSPPHEPGPPGGKG